MAGGMDTGQGGKGKKSLDVAINLTAFIDLMAVTISFLIMTAVWTQIGRLQVAQAGGPAMDQEQQEEQTKTVQLNLLITPTELRLSADQSTFDPIPLAKDAKGKTDLSKLVARFKELKAQIPDQQAITLQPEDKVRYEDLVRIIDECIGAGLPQVSVSAAMG
ncbi:biopolymer transporter ExbD [Pyxidicoccus fallax]|uniref:Biopolymer transporter ExbD n=1 Tax=Pyxidicoccus fallax TaxID=394095 RepID=A0A848LRY7_9BACT|nr:biopolymer transporter ExbD [Pyxidicoccus fallax]NMO20451.1 biopolymer transporter ExbD [Pyxidicoccus fallax]NPC85285.1 biopolymer transporter ExbD [Pyxidicoccus fallax]